MKLTDCRPRFDWLLVLLALVVMVVGSVLTLTWVGAIVGVPMSAAALELLTKPKTVRDASCV